ncbi:MAG: response regulator transcription factor [Brachybacterium sp.]|nr:response regulator transcription factor [Brachybacterium sp.]
MISPSHDDSAAATPAPTIRVVVADDHPAVRSGLVTLLDSAPDIAVVAEAADGDAAVAAAREHRPDVVLTDVRMPGATGIEITPHLRETGANVLVISGFDLDDYVLGALTAGADGYLVKTESPQRILAAVRDVHRGDAVLSAAATRAVVGALRGRSSAPGPDGTAASPSPDPATADPGEAPRPAFTGREEDVLALVAEGLTNQQIASALFVEVTTVKSHLSHALVKLQLDSRVQAALWWQQHRG